MTVSNLIKTMMAIALPFSVIMSGLIASLLISREEPLSVGAWVSIGMIITYILGTLIGLLVIYVRIRPLVRMSKTVEEVSKGNFAVNIKKPDKVKDEIGMLSNSLNTLILTIKSVMNEFETLSHKVSVEGSMTYRADSSKYQGAFFEFCEGANNFIDGQDSSVLMILECLTKLEEGNFHINIPNFPGERGIITQQVEGIAQELSSLHSDISDLVQNVSIGNLSIRADESKYKGEWKEVIDELNILIDSVSNPLKTMSSLIAFMKDGDFRNRAKGEYEGEFRQMEDMFNASTESISSYIDEIEKMLADMAKGNLQGRIERKYVGSFDLIKRSVNSILTRLNDTMVDIAIVADGVSGGAQQLSYSSASLSDGVIAQTVSIQDLSDGIAKIDAQSRDNAVNAQKAAELAAISKSIAEEGNREMEQLLQSMEKITESSREIDSIISTIDEIAFQTNLLALNASVEASRAGENGKGFAVVAEEVRILAAQSGKAAQKTNALIQESMASIQEGMERADDTAKSLDNIVKTVVNVSTVISEIYESSLYQTASISEINKELQEISAVIEEGAASSEETASAAEILDNQVGMLKRKLSFFKTRIESIPVNKFWDTSEALFPELNMLENVQGNRVKHNKGDIIIAEGDKSTDTMYFVLAGSVQVIKGHNKANELILATLPTRSLFGEMALFLDEPRTASVIAHEDVLLLEIHKNKIHEFMEKNSAVASTIIETLCRRLSNVLQDLDVY